MNYFETICIGSGPASLFTAIGLVKENYTDILILEAGKKYSFEETKNYNSAFGGSSIGSDGKLTIHHQVGTTVLPEIVGLKQYYEYMDIVKNTYIDFKPTIEQRNLICNSINNADVEIKEYVPSEAVKKIRAKALSNNLDLLTYNVVHLGSDTGFFIGKNIHDYLTNHGVTIKCESKVLSVKKEVDTFYVTTNDTTFSCKNLVIGVGRSGANDFIKFMQELNVEVTVGNCDFGVRVEVNNEVCDKLLVAGIYDPKMLYRSKSSDTKCRTFCWNSGGEVVAEEYKHAKLIVANGHSNQYTKTSNTNFALLVTNQLPHPLQYLENLCKQVNLLAENNLMIQRLGDLKRGRRSTQKRILEGAVCPTYDAFPGSLAYVIPYRILETILEMLEAMDSVLPGINGDFTLLYTPEAKFYTNDVQINEYAETTLKNLFVVGDSTSKSRGQIASSVMGLMAAKGIIRS